MNRLGPYANDAERREAAAAWLVRLETDEANEADWLDFETWLGEPKNKQALSDIEEALAVVDDHRAAFQSAPARPNTLGLFFRSAVIAGLASAAAAMLFFVWSGPPTQSFSVAAPAHAPRTVVLADGTNVTLNRGALIEVRWSARERHVDLARGEAAFQVTHNEAAPFTVAANGAVIRDVGTEFNVLREGDALTVTVRTGAVRLNAMRQSLDMTPGDEAKLAGGLLQLRRVDVEAVMAWRQGRLVYRDAALAEVIASLNRYSDTPIRLGDTDVERLRFSGALRIEDGAAMASELEAFLPVRSEHNAAGIVIRSRASQDRTRP